MPRLINTEHHGIFRTLKSSFSLELCADAIPPPLTRRGTYVLENHITLKCTEVLHKDIFNDLFHYIDLKRRVLVFFFGLLLKREENKYKWLNVKCSEVEGLR